MRATITFEVSIHDPDSVKAAHALLPLGHQVHTDVGGMIGDLLVCMDLWSGATGRALEFDDNGFRILEYTAVTEGGSSDETM